MQLQCMLVRIRFRDKIPVLLTTAFPALGAWSGGRLDCRHPEGETDPEQTMASVVLECPVSRRVRTTLRWPECILRGNHDALPGRVADRSERHVEVGHAVANAKCTLDEEQSIEQNRAEDVGAYQNGPDSPARICFSAILGEELSVLVCVDPAQV